MIDREGKSLRVFVFCSLLFGKYSEIGKGMIKYKVEGIYKDIYKKGCWSLGGP